MKALLALVLAASASSAFSMEANMFECKGKGINVSMSASSFAGVPTLVIRSTEAIESRPISLVHVKRVESAMGQEVSGFYDGIADASIVYTLIVPNVYLANGNLSDVEGMLVESFAGGLMPPSASQFSRALERNTYTPVTCTASAAQF